jgi:hypothetical protein
VQIQQNTNAILANSRQTLLEAEKTNAGSCGF